MDDKTKKIIDFKSQVISRRGIFKVISGLFAFAPAIAYLSNASVAFAYPICQDRKYIVCYKTEEDQECKAHSDGTRTWYADYWCKDTRADSACWIEQRDTGVPC